MTEPPTNVSLLVLGKGRAGGGCAKVTLLLLCHRIILKRKGRRGQGGGEIRFPMSNYKSRIERREN